MPRVNSWIRTSYWNDIFVLTYRMNLDQGMSREDVVDSTRQNANDTVRLRSEERGLELPDLDLRIKRRSPS